MPRSVPRKVSRIGALCALFLFGAHSCASLAAPTPAERNAGGLFDLVPPPDVQYPVQSPVTGFDIDGTKPPVSPAEPEPESPRAHATASAPPSLEKLLRHVASDADRQQTASTAVRAGGKASPVASVSTAFPSGAASSTSKISGGAKRISTATAALPAPKTSPVGQAPVAGAVKPGSTAAGAVASPTIVQAPAPTPIPIPASSSKVVAAPIVSPAPLIASPAATASVDVSPPPASPIVTLPTASPSEVSAAVTASQPTDTASTPAVQDERKTAGENASETAVDAILQKAREYHEVGSFKKMLALLDENQDLVGDMPEAAVLRLEQYLNDPQPDYRLMRSAAGIVLERDGNDTDANYAMGLYWSSLKKPDLGKALKHLALAKNAKKPRSGAASLYWRLYVKNTWYLFLLPLVIIAAAIDKRRKRQAGLPAAEAAPDQGGRGRLSSLVESLKMLVAKVRRQPVPPSGESPDDRGPDKGPGENA